MYSFNYYFMANEHMGRMPAQEGALSLKAILGDQKKSALFGEMLKTQKRLDVAERLRTKQTTEADITMMTGEGMKEFEKSMKSAEKLSSLMTPQNLEKLRASKSEKMQTMFKAIGMDGIRNAIAPNIEILAIRDPKRIENLIKSFEFMVTREQQQKDADAKLNGFFENYNVSKDAYEGIMNDPALTPAARNMKFEQLIYDKMGRIPGLRHKTKEKNRAQRDIDVQARANELHDRGEIKVAKTQYEFALRNVGDFLGSVMFGNETTKQAFNSILHGEEYQQEELLSFEEAKQITLPEQDELKSHWEQWSEQETQAGRPKDAEAESARKERFSDSYVGGKTDNKKGAWSDIMKNLIKGLAKFGD